MASVCVQLFLSGCAPPSLLLPRAELSRVLQPVKKRSRHVICSLCTPDGSTQEQIFTKGKSGYACVYCMGEYSASPCIQRLWTACYMIIHRYVSPKHMLYLCTLCTIVALLHVHAVPCIEWPEAASGETYWMHPAPHRHQLRKTLGSDRMECKLQRNLGVSLFIVYCHVPPYICIHHLLKLFWQLN